MTVLELDRLIALPVLGPPGSIAEEARFAGPRERRWAPAEEGRTVAYVEAGSGPPVLLIHGALMTLDDMVLGPFDLLAETHRVVAVDRPGHGGTERVRVADASPWAQARLIHAAAQSLGLEKPVVVGHSYGGAVATAHGLLFPEETAGVVALAPMVVPEPRLELFLFGPRAILGAGEALAWQGRRSLDRALLPVLWRAMFLPQTLPDRFRREFPFDLCGREETSGATGEDAGSIATALWKSMGAYHQLRPPLVVLAGDADFVINNALHGAMLSRVTRRSRFVSLRGMGHMLHHFEQEAVRQAVAEVLGVSS